MPSILWCGLPVCAGLCRHRERTHLKSTCSPQGLALNKPSWKGEGIQTGNRYIWILKALIIILPYPRKKNNCAIVPGVFSSVVLTNGSDKYSKWVPSLKHHSISARSSDQINLIKHNQWNTLPTLIIHTSRYNALIVVTIGHVLVVSNKMP